MTDTAARIYRAFGRRLRAERKRAKLTQSELANAVGLSRTSITNIETGRQPVHLHMVVSLAAVLGTTAAELLPPTDHSELTDEMNELLEQLPATKRAWVARMIQSSVVRGEDANGREDLNSQEESSGAAQKRTSKRSTSSH